MREIDFTPSLRSLLADRNKNFGWRKCLGELIDNAFDAGATAIDILLEPHKFVIATTGAGAITQRHSCDSASMTRNRTTQLECMGSV